MFEDPQMMQLLGDMAEGEDNRHINVESTEDDEVDKDETASLDT